MTYLAMTRGDDRTLTVTASEDLDGADLEFTARRRPYSDIVIHKRLGAGITLGDPTTTAVVAIDADDTDDLTPDVLYWDLQVVDTANETHTVARGRLAIEPDITYGS